MVTCKLKVNNTNVLIKGQDATGEKKSKAELLTGARLLFTLYVISIDPATTVTATITHSFSGDVPQMPLESMQLAGVGHISKIATDVHNQLEFAVNVVGGNATYFLGVSVYDNAVASQVDARIENAELNVDLNHLLQANGRFDSIRLGDGFRIADIISQGGKNALVTSSIEALPSAQPIKYRTEFLLDGASEDMTVDGSVTPVVFERIFATSEIAFLEKFVLELRDSGGSGLGDFGSGPALTNGILIELQQGGVITHTVIIKNNAQLISASDAIFEITQFQGSPLLVYNFIFRQEIAMNYNDDSDFFRVTVRDDLTGIEALQMAIKRWEVV